jgi:carotenoid cleavage dioxygenase-like enzyme
MTIPEPVDPIDVHELQGIFAAVHEERDLDEEITVSGRVPDDLQGAYLRNGPNPLFPPLGRYDFPFDGDAMVHGLWFDEGKVRYRNRFVWTDELRLERDAGKALFGGVLSGYLPDEDSVPAPFAGTHKTTPFINVIEHSGRVFACAEGQSWWEIDASLATVGAVRFDQSMARLTAHPKRDPITGELVVFVYRHERPYLSWGIVGPRGEVVAPMQGLDVPDEPLMVHDFAITEHHLVFVLAPLLFDPTGQHDFGPIAWQPQRGTTIAVVPRPGVPGGVRLFQTDAFWMWHVANAFESDGRIVVDTHRMDDPFATSRGSVHLVRITIDLAADRVAMDLRDDRACEFPRIDDRLIGRRHPWFVISADSGDNPFGADAFDLLWRVEADSGAITERRLGTEGIGESIFAPRVGAEGGYVLSYLYTQTGETTDLVILDVDDIAGDEIARVHLPLRVPLGLHGSWLEG